MAHRSSPDEAAAWARQYYGYHPAAAVPVWESRPFQGAEDGGVASASRSHCEAEKRRRDRINAQLATLRKLIPMSEKMDKAALLGQVVDHVKEQSKQAKEVSKIWMIPTETDQVTIDYLETQQTGSQTCIKVSICCDDRPELFAELNSAIKGLGLSIAGAEITGLGGRTKINFVLSSDHQKSCRSELKQSLQLALSRIVFASGAEGFSGRSKRQRLFDPNYEPSRHSSSSSWWLGVVLCCAIICSSLLLFLFFIFYFFMGGGGGP